MKKVGIITFYHNNNNYGGVAQAFALYRYFTDLGYDTEIITYKKSSSNLNLTTKNNSIKKVIKRIKRKIEKKIIKEPIEKLFKNKYKNELENRSNKLESFRQQIKHTKIYDSHSIIEIKDKYDYFVTGSDQTWNPGSVDDNFVFNFLNKDSKIFSYAPSVAVSEFSENYKNFMRNSLSKYKLISVREENSKYLFQEMLNRDVSWVVDPTMLVDKKVWNELASERLIREKYVFSYILGESIKQRNKVKKFAKEKGLKLVTIPYIKNGNKFQFKIEDYKFGDYQMLDISFEDFLSLIKYSDYVVTDSFHAVSFSYIFEREFYVINRDSVISMNSRIDSILKILQLPNRHINSGKVPNNNERIDYKKVNEFANEKIDYSRKYIKKALEI